MQSYVTVKSRNLAGLQYSRPQWIEIVID